MINLKTVWLYIFFIIITSWDVDVLIDIVLQDIDMRQNVGLCTSRHYMHALQCTRVYFNMETRMKIMYATYIHDGEISLLHTN